jgi:membrane protease YdiL (CAAX protease family)
MIAAERNPFSEIPACDSYRDLFGLFLFAAGFTLALAIAALILSNKLLKLNLDASEAVSLIQGTVYVFLCLKILRDQGTDISSVWRDWRANFGRDALNALKYYAVYLLLIGSMLALAMAAFHFPASRDAAAGAVSFGAREELYTAAREIVGGSRFSLALMFFSFCVLAPIGEELFFRRIVYVALRKKLSFLRALFASSVIFAASHGAASLSVFPVSLLLGYVYEKKRRLPVNIMLHGLINLFALAVRLT